MKTVAIIVFIAVYVLLLALPNRRAYVSVAAAALFVILGIVPFTSLGSAINWNVLMMLAGTMGTVDLFIQSKMPAQLADRMVSVLPSVKWVFIALAVFAGIVSAFIDNVATVLMVAPIGIAVCKKLNVSPVPAILSIAICSNLEGAATLVGDTTSVLLAGHMGLDFSDFFVFEGKPGMFWVVQVGLLATIPVMLFLFRREKQAISIKDITPVTDYVPTILLVGTVVGLIIASFVPNKPEITNGVICMVIFLVGLLWEVLRATDRKELLVGAAKSIDYTTLFLLAGLFVIIQGVTNVGLIDDLSRLLSKAGGGNVFLTYTIIVWGSVLLSAFIDNIPYTATMLPVVAGVAASLGIDQAVLCFGLLAGATLGGNLTPIGASANIAGCGILRKEGHTVSAGEFMRMSVPFTLIAVTVGYILIWVLYI